jgi:Zn-dependent peptidase ImmA (M78 family)
MAKAYVNPAIVEWAIDRSGFALTEIAAALKLNEAQLRERLANKEDLTVGELSALRKKLRRPSATFYLPEPPGDIEDVAHRVGPESKNKVRPANERIAIRKSKRIQNELREVLIDSRVNLEPIPNYSMTDAPKAVAEDMWSWLGTTSLVQETPAKTFRNLRDLFGKRSVYVLLHSFGDDGARGFSLQDEVAPVIGINTKLWNHSVRTYTAMHELGHVITRSSSSCSETWVSPDASHDPVERWCETFAAQFLMPESNVRAAIKPLSNGSPSEKAIRVANVFHVSRQAAFLRLRELNVLTWDDYWEHYKPDRDQKTGGAASPDDEKRTRAVNVRDMLGKAALDVINAGVRSEVISELDLVRLLGVSSSEINQFSSLDSVEEDASS